MHVDELDDRVGLHHDGTWLGPLWCVAHGCSDRRRSARLIGVCLWQAGRWATTTR